jgi:hypothetical protein
MSQTTSTSKRSPRLSFDEPIMVRYSPHHEFPLSTVSSVGLHALVIGLLIIGGIVIARLNWGGDVAPPPSDAVAMEPGGGGGNPNGIGNGPGDGATGDPDAPDAPLPDPNEQFEVGQPREQLKEARKDVLKLPEFDDEAGRRLIEEGGKEVDKVRRINAKQLKKLTEGLAAGKGQGGAGSGGGRGGGRGGGQGDSVGPGTGTAEERAKRVLRWVLIFNTRNGQDYANQLESFGAFLAIEPANPDDDFLVIRDLRNRPVRPAPEDVTKIHRIFWVDDNPASVRSLSQALGLPPPQKFYAFFPAEVEADLLEKELSYRNKKESEITETRFEVRRRGDGYVAVVVSQR